jgi:hypothetical protein
LRRRNSIFNNKPIFYAYNNARYRGDQFQKVQPDGPGLAEGAAYCCYFACNPDHLHGHHGRQFSDGHVCYALEIDRIDGRIRIFIVHYEELLYPGPDGDHRGADRIKCEHHHSGGGQFDHHYRRDQMTERDQKVLAVAALVVVVILLLGIVIGALWNFLF